MQTFATNPINALISVDKAAALIEGGAALVLAGSPEVLAHLPAGNWIAGTIPYFMTETGAAKSTDSIFVTRFSGDWKVSMAVYAADQTEQIVPNTPENGFSLAIAPWGSPALERFALTRRNAEDAFFKPVAGWVAGIDLHAIGSRRPLVYFGGDRQAHEDGIVVAHVTLPEGRRASLSIVNIFEPDGGDVIRFFKPDTTATECLVNGQKRALAAYMRERRNDSCILPLVGNFSGTSANVSIQSIGADGKVTFYAPVFPDIDYHLARPVADYAAAFGRKLQDDSGDAPVFACNCILNYLHGRLEGRKVGNVSGLLSFGEIANQVLNQTFVRLHIR